MVLVWEGLSDKGGRERGKVRKNGNVQMWHVKGGLGGVETPRVREDEE